MTYNAVMGTLNPTHSATTQANSAWPSHGGSVQ